MKTFFILSLPRSRTAWLANFLTYENSFCFHEGLLYVPAPDRLRNLFESTGKPVVGNSDCGNIFFVDELEAAFPDATFVVVKRDVVEVLDELREMGDEFSDAEQVMHAAWLLRQFMRAHPHVLTVDFHELDQRACKAIWKTCIGTPFDKTRWRTLDGLDVQIILQKKLEQVREYEHNVVSLFGGMH